jgi:hypothetical protein
MIDYDKVRKILIEYVKKKLGENAVRVNEKEIYILNPNKLEQYQTVCWKLMKHDGVHCELLGYSSKVERYIFKEYKFRFNEVDISLNQLMRHCEDIVMFWKKIIIISRKKSMESDFVEEESADV